MNIYIDNRSGLPIYEQIVSQIKNQIVSGTLADGAALPSMRQLARELGIDLATVELHARRHQAGLLGIDRARITFLQVSEHLAGTLCITGLRCLFDLAEQHRGLAGLIALPPLPGVQSGINGQRGNQGPGDQIAIAAPEALQGVELFLFLQV